jgi:hypothetical protein
VRARYTEFDSDRMSALSLPSTGRVCRKGRQFLHVLFLVYRVPFSFRQRTSGSAPV